MWHSADWGQVSNGTVSVGDTAPGIQHTQPGGGREKDSQQRQRFSRVAFTSVFCSWSSAKPWQTALTSNHDLTLPFSLLAIWQKHVDVADHPALPDLVRRERNARGSREMVRASQ
jgi:hypothetical protein